MDTKKTKILVLFPNDWDKSEFSRDYYTSVYNFDYSKYPADYFFKFPGYLKLPFFRVQKYIRRLVHQVNTEKYNAVISSDEYLGAIIAAEVSRQCGLKYSNPADIILCQHKYYSRKKQLQLVPDLAVDYQLIPIGLPEEFEPELSFPFFVKPVKGTYSLFAKRVNNLSDLKKHLDFNWFERLVLRNIIRPFNHLVKELTNLERNAFSMVGEELAAGIQVTVDGFVYNEDVQIMGIVDSVMFEGTNIFERFEFPSRLPEYIQTRIKEAVRKLIKGLKFDQLQFNVELFYNAETDRITIIEINPRLSYQFADMYENITGTNSYEIMLKLGLGEKPEFKKNSGSFKYSISFVLRTFEGKKLEAIPSEEEVKLFNERYPESRVKIYGTVGQKLDQEMRAIGSYRYGIINVGANSYLDIFAIYEHALDELTFEFDI